MRPSPRLFVALAFAAAATASIVPPAIAQQPAVSAATPGDPNAPVKIYLDCGYRCDEEFLKTEIAYVDWVRDRMVADVQVLVTTQQTGGSGTEYTFAFIGLRRFQGIVDTLVVVAPTTNSQDDSRRQIGRTIQAGLARYIARTPLASRLTVSVAAPAAGAKAQSTPAHDKWNLWTFRLSLNTNFNGERLYESRYYRSNVSANRTTNDWKISLSLNQSQNMSRFVVEDDSGGKVSYENFQREQGFNTLVVKSLGTHLSAGLLGSLGSSVYRNQDFTYTITPAVEYDIFPYSEATRRQLRIRYGVGVQGFDYDQVTIYGKMSEAKAVHTGMATLDLRQPWGSTSFQVSTQQYLTSPSFYRWSLFTNASLRVVKGLNVNFYGGYDRIRDQIFLPAKGASEQEILTRQRQLATGFSYWGGVGLSYTFGSIFNNIVNPRFGSGGGVIFID